MFAPMFLSLGIKSYFFDIFRQLMLLFRPVLLSVRPVLLLFALLAFAALPLLAQTGTSTSTARAETFRRTEIELRSDNDMYLMNMQDQYYTNGLFLNLRKTVDPSKLNPKEKNRLMEFRLGHEIYNAYTAQIDSFELVDRPITGYLFVSAGISHFYKKEDYLSYSLALGTIGKRAFGEELQAGLHNLLNMYHAAGWEFQLNNAWVADLELDHNKLIGRTRNRVLDVSLHSSVRLGTHQTNVKTGPVFRLGKLAAFDRSAHFNARLQSGTSGTGPVEDEWYLYYKPEAQLVFYDATMQGGMFLDDKGPMTSLPKRWLISNHFGGVYSTDALTFKIQYFFNTKESDQSLFRHQYGSLAMAYRF